MFEEGGWETKAVSGYGNNSFTEVEYFLLTLPALVDWLVLIWLFL